MSDRAEFEEWYANNFNRRPTEAGYETDICWQAWQAARTQSGQGAEAVADFRAEIRTERDACDEYQIFLVLVSGGKPQPYMYIPEMLDDTALDEALKRLNHAQPQSAGVPEGFVLMPESLTAENGAKYALSGEFHEVVELECTACDEDEDDCDVCSGHGSYTYRVPISWTTIKDIYSLAVSECSADTTPQPAGYRVRCSDRLPLDADADCEGKVWLFDTITEQWARAFYGEVCPERDSHWMPTGLKRPQPPREQGGEK